MEFGCRWYFIDLLGYRQYFDGFSSFSRYIQWCTHASLVVTNAISLVTRAISVDLVIAQAISAYSVISVVQHHYETRS
jgi:hypothetical protein